MLKFLRHNLWLVFLAHQALIFILAFLFLTSVRRLTGRTIHLGRDPIGLIDGAALAALSIGVIVLTRALYHWVKGKDATPLGIAFSARRLIDLIAGLLIGFTFAVAPYINGLLTGSLTIHDRIGAHFDSFTITRMVAVGFSLLLLQSVMEETANRAFPMRLWEHRSILFRLVVPSIFFALIHLADEDFSSARIAVLLMAGITHGLAYALTGNIWLTSGLHAGANFATFSISGLWHAGAILSLRGRPGVPNWIMVVLMLAAFTVAYVLSQKHKSRPPRLFTRET